MKKFLIFLFVILILIIGALFSFGNNLISEMTVSREQSELRSEPVSVGKDPIGILLIGVDGSTEGREQTGGDANNVRSDALIYASIDVASGKMSFVSIPRDTYVYIPCIDDYDKITNAYHYGLLENPDDPNAGVSCTVSSVEGLLDLPVDYFIQVNFDAFISIVDSIGGIEVTANNTFCTQDEFDNPDAYCFEEGVTYNMSGSMALAYARERYVDSDFMRGVRQQQIVVALLEKIMSDPINYGIAVVKAAKDYVLTNLQISDMISVGWTLLKSDPATYGDNLVIQNFRIYGADSYDEDGQYIFIPYEESLEYVVSKMNSILYEGTVTELDGPSYPQEDTDGVFTEGTPYL